MQHTHHIIHYSHTHARTHPRRLLRDEERRLAQVRPQLHHHARAGPQHVAQQNLLRGEEPAEAVIK